MTMFSSLTNRIFFASALLAVMAIAVAVYRVNVAVTAQAENELRRGLEEAGTLLSEYRNTLFEHMAREARLIADQSNFKAALTTRDAPTVQPLADEYQRRIGADLFVVTDPSGRLLAEAGRVRMRRDDPAARAPISRAAAGREAVSLWPESGGVIQVVTVPSVIGPELVGTVSVGFSLDEQAAQRFKAWTNSEVAFAVGDRIEASTLPAEFNPVLSTIVGARDIRTIRLGDEYVGLSRPLPLTSPGGTADSSPHDTAPVTALLLRSRTERLRFLNDVHRELAGTAFLAVLAATLVSYGVARSVTRPLGVITATMREMSATGDLTRKITLPSSRWEDEDARLLATTFNTMTDSIATFQREASQRERLSSLGRLSTVVAHEIRNPLMIIRTALHSLKRDAVEPQQLRSAVTDIDEEVTRLNRIVTDVLDFARPIKFETSLADVNVLCADAVKATGVDAPAVGVRLELDPGLPHIVTDGERLRLALVNIIANARHAVAARGEGAPPGDGITLATGRTANGRVTIVVGDRGVGIAPDDLPRVFDPYFTTRRTGTGLGLAISRNVIEGLGGTIAVSSRPSEGTDVSIELPQTAPSAGAGRRPRAT